MMDRTLIRRGTTLEMKFDGSSHPYGWCCAVRRKVRDGPIRFVELHGIIKARFSACFPDCGI